MLHIHTCTIKYMKYITMMWKSADCVSYVLLQQGYECTRRFLTEFIGSTSVDDDNQLENKCLNCCTASSLSRPNSSLQTPELVEYLSASCDSVPWRTALLEVSFGRDSNYSAASVLETQVWHHSVGCQCRLCSDGCDAATFCTCLVLRFVASMPTNVESWFV